MTDAPTPPWPLPYTRPPLHQLAGPTGALASYIAADTGAEANVDAATVAAFGEEWERFDQFDAATIDQIAREYFDVLPDTALSPTLVALDVGCGTGRWSRYLAPRVGWLEAVDPSSAALVAQRNLADRPNARVTQAGVSALPFAPGSFDLVICLGVLHHIPDTAAGMRAICAALKPGGRFLFYLYYALDGQQAYMRVLLRLVTALRGVVAALPAGARHAVSDVLAVLIYLPLVLISRAAWALGLRRLATRIPLHYYRDKSWYIIRNDARDRFGTPLEQRFTQAQLREMLAAAGFEQIVFSPQAPYWHGICQRPPATR